MAQCCATRRAVVLWIIMLLLGCFCLFVAFGAVDLAPQRQRQSPIDPSKDLIYSVVVRLQCLTVCALFFSFCSIL